MADGEHLWTSCQESLRTQVSDAVWRSTFQDITEIDVEDDILRLAVPSAMVKDRVEGRYLSLVEDIVLDQSGQRLSILLEVRPNAGESSTVSDPLDERIGARPAEVRTDGGAVSDNGLADNRHAPPSL
ncbi:MAG TPA: DnaA N-terminal domain-containing protein, partial [Acidimicrobiales bacterium]|nr:DnaA N-terminal domain-containing protein [Acidimicrobiales bacterium]